MVPGRRLCLYMPRFCTDRVRAGAAGGDRPLVLSRRVGASVLVEHCDGEAERLGLRPGMSLAQAQAIVPEVRVLPHEPRGDREMLRQLANWAVRFSPLVEPREPDTLLIDITGCERLFGGEANIARQAVTGLRQRGFCTHAAIADTVGAAYALALADAAAGRGAVIAPPGQTRACLAPLPPAALRIDPRVVARLEALGLRTIGDLLRLPRASLPARFGTQLVLRLRQALGEAFEGVGVHDPPQSPHARMEIEQPARDLVALEPVVRDLLADVFVQLRRLSLALRRLDCVLSCEEALPVTLSVGLSRPSRSVKHTGALLRERLERVDLSVGVCAVMLVARETARWRAGQGDLFEPLEPDGEEQLGCLIDRLAARLGYHTVLRSQLLDDYQPEAAFRYVSAANGDEPQGGDCRNPQPVARPVQLFQRPVPIRVIALVPDGPPSWFAYRGREYVVAASAGPERLETGWWRGADVRRDYFRVTAETGEQFWIFHAFHDRRWYMHGVFV